MNLLRAHFPKRITCSIIIFTTEKNNKISSFVIGKNAGGYNSPRKHITIHSRTQYKIMILICRFSKLKYGF